MRSAEIWVGAYSSERLYQRSSGRVKTFRAIKEAWIFPAFYITLTSIHHNSRTYHLSNGQPLCEWSSMGNIKAVFGLDQKLCVLCKTEVFLQLLLYHVSLNMILDLPTSKKRSQRIFHWQFFAVCRPVHWRQVTSPVATLSLFGKLFHSDDLFFFFVILACHLLGDYLESVEKKSEQASELYKKNCDENNYGHSCRKYGAYLIKGEKIDNPAQLALVSVPLHLRFFSFYLQWELNYSDLRNSTHLCHQLHFFPRSWTA